MAIKYESQHVCVSVTNNGFLIGYGCGNARTPAPPQDTRRTRRKRKKNTQTKKQRKERKGGGGG